MPIGRPIWPPKGLRYRNLFACARWRRGHRATWSLKLCGAGTDRIIRHATALQCFGKLRITNDSKASTGHGLDLDGGQLARPIQPSDQQNASATAERRQDFGHYDPRLANTRQQ